MATTTLVPVDVFFDPEVGTWHWSIDNPATVGGGQETKEAAMQAAAEAVAFALEPDGEPVPDPETGGTIELLEISVRPAQ